jgi:hypothetical protein
VSRRSSEYNRATVLSKSGHIFVNALSWLGDAESEYVPRRPYCMSIHSRTVVVLSWDVFTVYRFASLLWYCSDIKLWSDYAVSLFARIDTFLPLNVFVVLAVDAGRAGAA